MPIDLEPATTRLAHLVRNVVDEALDKPTPCDNSLGALLDHVQMLARAFAAAARKDAGKLTGAPRPPDAGNLGSDWRESIPDALDDLAHAWNEPDAWTGMTRIGGLEMPGEAAGIVALDEVVMHGWDVARATGQPYDATPRELDALMPFLTHMAEPDMAQARDGLFGPVVDVPDDASSLDRALALAGRDPAWAPG